MIRYVLNRAVSAAGVMIIVSVMVFSIIRLIPGDPITILLGENLSEDARAAMVAKWGLDRPVLIQYFEWIGGAATGDLGQSIRTQDDVGSLILQRIPATLSLAFMSMVIAIIVGVPTGVVAAYRANTGADRFAMLIALLGLCIPAFWLSLLLIMLFSIQLGWLPVSGYISPLVDFTGWLRHLALPALALGAGLAASISRMTRTSMLEVLSMDFIRTARAKGVTERTAVLSHALRNAMLPIITVIGLQLGFLLGGAVVVEEVFAVPGIGRLLIFGISNRDYPLIQGVVLVFAFTFILINLLVDLIYPLFEPRIRY